MTLIHSHVQSIFTKSPIIQQLEEKMNTVLVTIHYSPLHSDVANRLELLRDHV